MGGKKSVKLKNRDNHTIMPEIAFPLLTIVNTYKFQLLYLPSCISQTACTKEFIVAICGAQEAGYNCNVCETASLLSQGGRHIVSSTFN